MDCNERALEQAQAEDGERARPGAALARNLLGQGHARTSELARAHDRCVRQLSGPPVTLAVVRTAAMRAIEAAMRDDHMVFTVADLDGGEQLRVEDFPKVGVIARIERVQMGRGALQTVLIGQQRAMCLEYRAEEPLKAVVVPMQESPPPDPQETTFAALLREARERAIELGKGRGIDEDVIRRVLSWRKHCARSRAERHTRAEGPWLLADAPARRHAAP